MGLWEYSWVSKNFFGRQAGSLYKIPYWQSVTPWLNLRGLELSLAPSEMLLSKEVEI